MAQADLLYGDGQSLWDPREAAQMTIADPSGGDQDMLKKFRRAADDARFYENQTDTAVFSDPRFKHFAATGQYQPSSQAFPDNEIQNANFGQGRATQPAQTAQRQMVPSQFDDAYTKQLEGIASAQMGEVRNNPGLNQLTQFLQSRFGELSQTPGFSPAEMAVLNTQAFEPIEDLRAASKKRAEERTSARGMLPSSGLHELDLRDIDIAADKARAAAGRDVAINAIDRRDADLALAGNIANQLGLQIPGQQRSEELALSSLLYDLPSRALRDALAVVQGSPTSNDLFSQAVNLARVNQNNQLQNQQRWSQIAQLIAGMDF